MANPLPYLRNTSGTLNAQVLYPFDRMVSFSTKVTTFANGSEQRWALRPPFCNFDIPMNQLLAADKAAWLTFFGNVKGRFASDLSITLGSTTYANLTLASDDLSV